MEDRNEIGDSEVNRLDLLKRIVKKHRLVVIGGDVQGGFGKLKESDDPHEQLSHLENSVNQFGYSSEDVDVSGNFDDGINFS